MSDPINTPDLVELKQKLDALSTQLEDYKKQSEDRFCALSAAMKRAEKRTDKLEQLSQQLADMLTAHKEQLIQFHNNISELNRGINDLLQAKQTNDLRQQQNDERLGKVDVNLAVIATTIAPLSNLPTDVGQLSVAMSNMKSVTDTIKQIGMLFAAGIITLVLNSLFGGG